MTSGSAGGHRSELAFDSGFLDYDFGPQHPLRPERITAGLELLEHIGLWDSRRSAGPVVSALDEEIFLIHDVAYVDAVRRAGSEWFPRGELARFGLTQADNPAFPGMHEAASLVAGGTVSIVRRILNGELNHGFNPAGGLHHALRSRASGFCIYNDPALAAAVAARQFDARVLYVDVDCHHGDGVQWLFYDDSAVLTVSLHESGRYLFPGTGEVDEVGSGDGTGFAVNVPMAPFTQDDDWLIALREVVLPLAKRFQPDLLISAHGADTHIWDPLTHLSLTSHAFVEQAKFLHELAHEHTKGRWLAVGSGGYDWRRVVPRSWAILWAEMTGQDLPIRLPSTWIQKWQEHDGDAIPATMLDDESLRHPVVRAAEVNSANRRTLQHVLETHAIR